MESYSLFQLTEYIRRVVALNFREPLWIEAEISQINDSRGNQYLELIEKDDEGQKVVAQMSGAIWSRKFQFIKRKLGDLVYDLLIEGTQVRLKCTIDYHERYGMKLIIEDIDPNYTFGKLELKRQEIINRLEEEGLMELNKSLIVPTVIQRIAVISSANAAGYQDFKNQLLHNGYGYTFKIDLYDGVVQGVKVEKDTTSAIKEILKSKMGYDIVTIIRGGGSKLDLSGFDSYEIAKDIAISDIPFVIGIGHDIDSTVTDLVACLSLKTPTAVADYIIDRNMTFEARIEQEMNSIHRASTNTLRTNELQLNSIQDRLRANALQLVFNQQSYIEYSREQLAQNLKAQFINIQHQHERISLLLDAHDPSSILSQGYSFILKDGDNISSTDQLKKDDMILIRLSDGSVNSKIL